MKQIAWLDFTRFDNAFDRLIQPRFGRFTGYDPIGSRGNVNERSFSLRLVESFVGRHSHLGKVFGLDVNVDMDRGLIKLMGDLLAFKQVEVNHPGFNFLVIGALIQAERELAQFVFTQDIDNHMHGQYFHFSVRRHSTDSFPTKTEELGRLRTDWRIIHISGEETSEPSEVSDIEDLVEHEPVA
jgi:hypothetical protein